MTGAVADFECMRRAIWRWKALETHWVANLEIAEQSSPDLQNAYTLSKLADRFVREEQPAPAGQWTENEVSESVKAASM